MIYYLQIPEVVWGCGAQWAQEGQSSVPGHKQAAEGEEGNEHLLLRSGWGRGH